MSLIIGIIIFIITIIGVIIAYWGILKVERYLPEKVRINENGIYIWKRNKTEELIAWNDIYSIEKYDKLVPSKYKEYIIVRKQKNVLNSMGLPTGIPLDYEEGHKAYNIFNEYKAKRNEFK